MLTKESLDLLRVLVLIQIEELKDTFEKQAEMWGKHVVWLCDTKTHKEMEARRDLLASTLCALEQQLDVIKEEETAASN